MSGITTHVLDTALGRPAAGVPITLEVQSDAGAWESLGKGVTDDDGRLRALVDEEAALGEGLYRISFDTGTYFSRQGTPKWFYPSVSIVFEIHDPREHFHVPLLLSPWGYSTYRGS